MGRTRTVGATPLSGERAQRERFATYFPRVFAYVHSSIRDDTRSKEIVSEAFARVFGRGDLLSDEDFPIALFSVTRDLCEEFRGNFDNARGILTGPEREVLALLFDGQLTKGQVGDLLQIREDTVASTLVHGLKKIRRVVSRELSPSLLQL